MEGIIKELQFNKKVLIESEGKVYESKGGFPGETVLFKNKRRKKANILEILNNLSRKINVAIYMNESYVAIAFQSNHFLFSAPATGWGVEKLSLAGEYEQIRTKLADFYALIDIIGEKF